MQTSSTRAIALTTLAVSALTASPFWLGQPATAAVMFAQKEVDQSKMIAIAAPYGQQAQNHQLLILEQVSNKRACWRETNAAGPTQVDPLLLNFNFTGICGRSTDSNGYSLRTAGQDLGLQYSLRVVKRHNDLVLVGIPRDSRQSAVEIGRTQGVTNGFAKIHLNPGWRFTKRMYNGKALGHVYLTNDQPVTAIAANPGTLTPTPGIAPTAPTPKPPVTIPTPTTGTLPPRPTAIPPRRLPVLKSPVTIPVPPPLTGNAPMAPLPSSNATDPTGTVMQPILVPTTGNPAATSNRSSIVVPIVESP